MLIVTSSPEVGTLSELQFAAVSQLLSPPPPVQETAESSVLGSIHSSCGWHDFDCFGLRFDSERNGSASMVMTSKQKALGKTKVCGPHEPTRLETTFIGRTVPGGSSDQ